LAKIREGLRGEIRNSPLMDNGGFTRDMEQHYRTIWQHWCE
jgi:predicted O-linked N-acetylglucosamine transferase (SPINDLY family)